MDLDQAMILCDGLVKIYKVADLEVVALQGLDLVVSRGEMVGVVGSSGSGKSTLMNILGGLDYPSAGRVWVNGQDLLGMTYAELFRYRRSTVGFVWQQGERNLIPYLTAFENIMLPITISGSPRKEGREWAEELLSSVGLIERRCHRLTELSGGEQQRVAIAIALANRPQLLLADEPTGELDSRTAARVFELLQSLNRQYELTTLIVSHDRGIAGYVDRLVSIQDGKTSTETVRLSTEDDFHSPRQEIQAVDDIFTEVILLDSAGRLQLPREYLEAFHIQNRVHLELVDDGILIRPSSTGISVQSLSHSLQEAKAKQRRLNALFRQIKQIGRKIRQ